MKPTDPRLSRASVEKLPDDEYFWTLMEPAWDDESKGTHGQYVLASTTYFIRDVGNGGLEQALWNFDPRTVDSVLKNLDLLGAEQIARLIRSGIQRLFGDFPPPTLNERRAVINGVTREWLDENLELLNEQLYGEERLWPYYRRYIDQHPSEFFRG